MGMKWTCWSTPPRLGSQSEPKEVRVNQKQWIAAGIILLLLVIVFLILPRAASVAPQATAAGASAAELGYCADEQTKPCVVSFSVDARDNMIVNLLLPDRSFPPFSLRITRASAETSYACQRLTGAVNNAYCYGPKQPPGERLTLRLVSTGDETLLAQGDLSIIGLAFPTLGIAVITPQDTPTSPVESPLPTASPLLPPPTKPLPSYPNPSYP